MQYGLAIAVLAGGAHCVLTPSSSEPEGTRGVDYRVRDRTAILSVQGRCQGARKRGPPVPGNESSDWNNRPTGPAERHDGRTHPLRLSEAPGSSPGLRSVRLTEAGRLRTDAPLHATGVEIGLDDPGAQD